MLARKTRLVTVLSTTAAAGTALGIYVIPTHSSAKPTPELAARIVQAPAYDSLDARSPAPAEKLPAVALPQQPAPHAVLAAAPTVLTVRSGDTLSALAATVGRTWEQLAAFNRLTDANFITPGELLTVPPAGYVGHYNPPVQYSPPAVHHASAPAHPVTVTYTTPMTAVYQSGGVYGYSALESLWESVGGPAWAAPHAAEIAMCESGGESWAHNPSGATGLWQILGSVVPGNLYDPRVNAENAVAKFHGSHDTFAQWVCG